MSGYKTHIKSLKPVCFLTFDDDQSFNRATGVLTSEHIFDESLNNNYGIVECDALVPQTRSYMMGVQSLVTREISAQQYSFMFAYNGYNAVANFPYVKTLIEVPHSASLNIKTDFSVSFLFKLERPPYQDSLAQLLWDPSTEKYYVPNHGIDGRTYRRTLFRKGNIVQLVLVYTAYDRYFELSLPGFVGQYKIEKIWNFYDAVHHVTVTQKSVKLSNGLYKTVRRLYINGMLCIDNVSDITHTPYSAENPSSFLIGGNRDAYDMLTLDDRQTSPLTVDQFAVFDYALSERQVCDCFKKTLRYIDHILRQQPHVYLPLSGDKSLPNNRASLYVNGTLANSQNNLGSAYYSTGEVSLVQKDVKIDTRLMSEQGASFTGATVKIDGPNANTPLINPAGDFTLEFWFSLKNENRCILFTATENNHPYSGITVECNRSGNSDFRGGLQVVFADGDYLTCPLYSVNGVQMRYNDGELRHFALTRKGDLATIYIDGLMVVEKIVDSGPLIDSYGVVNVMGASPSNLTSTGILAHLAVYNRALSEGELSARAFFDQRMMLQGRVTVQGQPVTGCAVRVFDHYTAVLLSEVLCDQDGYYKINTYSNNYLDLVYLHTYDTSVTQRAVGMVLAERFNDFDD